jgi:hypothetical protein
MVMKYAGKIINGQPKLLEPVKLPENAEITIIIDLPVKTERKAFTLAQRETARNVLTALENIKEDGFTEEDKEAFARWDSGEFRVKFEERLP